MKSIILTIILAMMVAGCSPSRPSTSSQNVNSTMDPSKQKIGLLLDGKIADQTWSSQAYQGLRKIKEKYGVQIDYRENVISRDRQIAEAENMAKSGFNLIIGNGAAFQQAFNQVAVKYPRARFVFFNAAPQGKNVTAIFYNPSLGYFSGMIAGLYTKTHKIGVIPAYPYSKTLVNFIEGAKEQDPRNKVYVEVVGDWNNKKIAGENTDKLLKQGVDILAPLGDGYNIEVVMRAAKAHAHVIGYISDLSYMSNHTVITNAEQDLTASYLKIADDFLHNRLRSGKVMLDFKDKAQFFSPFDPNVSTKIPEQLQKRINDYNKGDFKIPTFPYEGEMRAKHTFSFVY